MSYRYDCGDDAVAAANMIRSLALAKVWRFLGPE